MARKEAPDLNSTVDKYKDFPRVFCNLQVFANYLQSHTVPTQVDFMFRHNTYNKRISREARLPCVYRLSFSSHFALHHLSLHISYSPGSSLFLVPFLLRCLVFLLLFYVLIFSLMYLPIVLSAIHVKHFGRCSQAANPRVSSHPG
jgi:hypothetical protein